MIVPVVCNVQPNGPGIGTLYAVLAGAAAMESASVSFSGAVAGCGVKQGNSLFEHRRIFAISTQIGVKASSDLRDYAVVAGAQFRPPDLSADLGSHAGYFSALRDSVSMSSEHEPPAPW